MKSTVACNEPAAEAVGDLLAEIASLKAEVARLQARLAEAEGLADRDALTAALNRRALLRELSRTIARRARYGTPACFVYFDLDGLKTINDRFGHPAGDAALRAAAERIGRGIREADAIGRLGGDEFAVILAEVDRHAAHAKAGALADAVAGEPLMLRGEAVALRLSWGVAEIAPDADPEAVLAEADLAMYARKRAGRRNRSR